MGPSSPSEKNLRFEFAFTQPCCRLLGQQTANHPSQQKKQKSKDMQELHLATLQGTSISHFGKRNVIFKNALVGKMLAPWRVVAQNCWPQESMTGILKHSELCGSLLAFFENCLGHLASHLNQQKQHAPPDIHLFLIADQGAKVIYPYIGTYHLLIRPEWVWWQSWNYRKGATPYIGVVIMISKVPFWGTSKIKGVVP